jgi:hypothetical protein
VGGGVDDTLPVGDAARLPLDSVGEGVGLVFTGVVAVRTGPLVEGNTVVVVGIECMDSDEDALVPFVALFAHTKTPCKQARIAKTSMALDKLRPRDARPPIMPSLPACPLRSVRVDHAVPRPVLPRGPTVGL